MNSAETVMLKLDPTAIVVKGTRPGLPCYKSNALTMVIPPPPPPPLHFSYVEQYGEYRGVSNMPMELF